MSSNTKDLWVKIMSRSTCILIAFCLIIYMKGGEEKLLNALDPKNFFLVYFCSVVVTLISFLISKEDKAPLEKISRVKDEYLKYEEKYKKFAENLKSHEEKILRLKERIVYCEQDTLKIKEKLLRRIRGI